MDINESLLNKLKDIRRMNESDGDDDFSFYTYNDEESDSMPFEYSDFGDGGVVSGQSFDADGEEYTWEKPFGDVHQMDFDRWQVWSASNDYIDEIVYFVVDIDTNFIDWGPVETVEEATEYLDSKQEEYDMDESFHEAVCDVKKESLLQDLHADHEAIRTHYGQDVYDALEEYTSDYGYDLGSILYNKVEWDNFDRWLRDVKNIKIDYEIPVDEKNDIVCNSEQCCSEDECIPAIEDKIDESPKDESLIETRNNYGNKGPWWYFTLHGVQPGSIPNDVKVIETREGENEKGTKGTFVLLDGVLTSAELKDYDMKELAPNDKEIDESLMEYVKDGCEWSLVWRDKDGQRQHQEFQDASEFSAKARELFDFGIDAEVNVSCYSDRKSTGSWHQKLSYIANMSDDKCREYLHLNLNPLKMHTNKDAMSVDAKQYDNDGNLSNEYKQHQNEELEEDFAVQLIPAETILPAEQTQVPVQPEVLAPVVDNMDCVRNSANDVIASYQNANKWLDIIKEYLFTDLGCVFMSSYIHELAHTMPSRFDDFGDILHTIDMRIPYPATAYIPNEPQSMDDVFNLVFMILDDIKAKLNAFIKCTDENYHGMACATETLLNDIEEEYVPIYKMKKAWETYEGNTIRFDKWVGQYTKERENLTESANEVHRGKLNEDLFEEHSKKSLSESWRDTLNDVERTWKGKLILRDELGDEVEVGDISCYGTAEDWDDYKEVKVNRTYKKYPEASDVYVEDRTNWNKNIQQQIRQDMGVDDYRFDSFADDLDKDEIYTEDEIGNMLIQYGFDDETDVEDGIETLKELGYQIKSDLSEDASKEWKPNTSFRHIRDIYKKVKDNDYTFVNNEQEEWNAAQKKVMDKSYTPEQRKLLRDWGEEIWRAHKDTNESLTEEAEDENKRYHAASYMDVNYRGLEDDIDTDDFSELKDWIWEHLNKGGGIIVDDNSTGKQVRFNPDEIDFLDIDDPSEWLNDMLKLLDEELSEDAMDIQVKKTLSQ